MTEDQSYDHQAGSDATGLSLLQSPRMRLCILTAHRTRLWRDVSGFAGWYAVLSFIAHHLEGTISAIFEKECSGTNTSVMIGPRMSGKNEDAAVNTAERQCVQFFVKAPEPGRVKTRLAAAIGTEAAGELYRCFVEDLVAILDTLDDAVVGPSSDGGYYLLGFRAERFVTEVFYGVRWSTEHVYDETLRILSQHGKRVALLPRWHDVDTRSDLDELIECNRDTESLSSRTLRLARSSGWGDPGKESAR